MKRYAQFLAVCRPTVWFYITSAVAYTYGYGDGRIGPTRCAFEFIPIKPWVARVQGVPASR